MPISERWEEGGRRNRVSISIYPRLGSAEACPWELPTGVTKHCPTETLINGWKEPRRGSRQAYSPPDGAHPVGLHPGVQGDGEGHPVAHGAPLLMRLLKAVPPTGESAREEQKTPPSARREGWAGLEGGRVGAGQPHGGIRLHGCSRGRTENAPQSGSTGDFWKQAGDQGCSQERCRESSNGNTS